jgi:hypothetical protein
MRLISFYEIVNILSLSFFSYEGFRGGLVVSRLKYDQKKKTLDWFWETRFSIYMKRLIDYVHELTCLLL